VGESMICTRPSGNALANLTFDVSETACLQRGAVFSFRGAHVRRSVPLPPVVLLEDLLVLAKENCALKGCLCFVTHARVRGEHLTRKSRRTRRT
jgi:hypothetical protein